MAELERLDIAGIDDQLPETISHLLVCASYERRCLTAVRHFGKAKVRRASVFYFEEFEEASAENMACLVSELNARTVKMSYRNPLSVADALERQVLSSVYADDDSIVVDISTFTRESLLILMGFFHKHRHKLGKVYYFYRCARVGDALSGRVDSVRGVLGYMGVISPLKPFHLIVMSGFEYERARAIIDIVEPDRISIGYGGEQQSIFDDHYKRNLAFTRRLETFYSDEVIQEFSYSLRDPHSTQSTLLDQAKLFPEHNTVIAPLNNKISTVGAGLAARLNKNIQLIYSTVESYNVHEYSEPDDFYYIFSL